MTTTNVFYRLPSKRGVRVASIAGTSCTLDQFCNYIIDSEGINGEDFIVACGTKVFRPTSCTLQSISLENNSHVDILIPLLGGKGGFGSLLRAIGAQIEKTTNRDACRDLQGRRLRDVKREEELKKLIALRNKLIEERKLKRKEKLEKLKKKSEASATSASIQELVSMFDDHAYNKRRLEIGEIIEAAIQKGIINSKKTKPVAAANADNELCRRDDAETEPETSNQSAVVNSKQKMNQNDDNNDLVEEIPKESTTKFKKNDLWLGLEEDLDI